MIESERKLIEVQRQILRGDLVIDAPGPGSSFSFVSTTAPGRPAR